MGGVDSAEAAIAVGCVEEVVESGIATSLLAHGNHRELAVEAGNATLLSVGNHHRLPPFRLGSIVVTVTVIVSTTVEAAD